MVMRKHHAIKNLENHEIQRRRQKAVIEVSGGYYGALKQIIPPC